MLQNLRRLFYVQDDNDNADISFDDNIPIAGGIEQVKGSYRYINYEIFYLFICRPGKMRGNKT